MKSNHTESYVSQLLQKMANDRLHERISRFDLPSVQESLESGAQPDAMDNNGSRPLVAATQNKAWWVIPTLLEHGAKVVLTDRKTGKNALQHAALNYELTDLLTKCVFAPNTAMFNAARTRCRHILWCLKKIGIHRDLFPMIIDYLGQDSYMGYRWTERKLRGEAVPPHVIPWIEHVLLHSTILEAKRLHKKYLSCYLKIL